MYNGQSHQKIQIGGNPHSNKLCNARTVCEVMKVISNSAVLNYKFKFLRIKLVGKLSLPLIYAFFLRFNATPHYMMF